jgi:hypothetical protein
MTAPSTHTQSFVFQPDDEHRSRISDCVRKDGIQLNCRGIIDFAHNIETSIATFLKAKANTSESYRQARNALRDLWQLSHEADDDISVRLLRARLLRLPKLALDYLDMRARLTSLELLDSVDGGFLTWAENADATRLVEMIRQSSAVGARLVSRSRGRGKRSRARLEPVIFGQARGDGGGVDTGGRPCQDARDTLVMHLAVDWTIAADAEPLPGRSDHAGFGDLVHSVFQWLHEPSPDQALRRYWNDVEKGRRRSAA